MKTRNPALQYKTTDQINVVNNNDPNAILIKCYDELLNSIKIFHNNIIPHSNNFRKKSSSFSRALTILYTLQSSIDFEQDLKIAKNLFQIYEYTRICLINEFKTCKVAKSIVALKALTEIRDVWKKTP